MQKCIGNADFLFIYSAIWYQMVHQGLLLGSFSTYITKCMFEQMEECWSSIFQQNTQITLLHLQRIVLMLLKRNAWWPNLAKVSDLRNVLLSLCS